MNELLDCGVAIRLVLEHCERVEAVAQRERLALHAAQGRVLSQEIVADRDQPPFERSTRDGFALRSTDGGDVLRVLGVLRAGESWSGAALRTRECVEIMTGAPLPDGADAVMMVEHVERVGQDGVRLLGGRTIASGENVVARGSEALRGEVLLRTGARLGPAELALAASVGAASVDVCARPRACILATGDELVGVDEEPMEHQIRNSNTYGIAALCREAGAEPVTPPPVRDTVEALEAALDAARDADLLILSGGVSAGKYDFVETALANRGAEFFFTGVKMQPGKPVVFGRLPARDGRREQYFFGAAGKSNLHPGHVPLVRGADAAGAGRGVWSSSAICAGHAGARVQGGARPDALSPCGHALSAREHDGVADGMAGLRRPRGECAIELLCSHPAGCGEHRGGIGGSGVVALVLFPHGQHLCEQESLLCREHRGRAFCAMDSLSLATKAGPSTPPSLRFGSAQDDTFLNDVSAKELPITRS